MAQIGRVTLHCIKCDTELASREILMLASIPPSQRHLAVKEGKEDMASPKLAKFANTRSEKSAKYCPYIFHCRSCNSHVGNVTKLATKELICYKIDNVYLFHYGKKITAKKLSKITKILEEKCGIEVVNVSEQGDSSCCASRVSDPMIYCDTRGLTHTSREIDSLTRQIPRDYQRELFLSAVRGNTLVYLPTGSGKTLIAAMVLSCMKKLNPNKIAVFLVDRVPLAYQQSDYTKSQLPDLKVETLVGEMDPEDQRKIHKSLADNKVDVLVLTHQIFLNFLADLNPPIRLNDVSVLVFDEAHHCTGNHQYKQIMDHYNQTPNQFKPVVLGLTASPAGEATVEITRLKLETLLENLSCTIAMPVVTSEMVQENIPDTLYEVSDCLGTRQVILKERIKEHIEYLRTSHLVHAPGGQALQGLPLFSPNFRGALRRMIDRCHGNKKQLKALIIGEHAMHMLSVADLSEVLGYKYAIQCLKECVYRTIQAVSPKESALKKMIGSQPSFLALKGLANRVVEEYSPVSDRFNILVTYVKKFLVLAQVDNTSRGIIFVSMRKTAYKLCEEIKGIPNVKRWLNPVPFVGHGRGSYDGMGWRDEQEVLLKEFRSGVTKLLVCTSVLEEGLDVPQCNLVVRFEGAATLRALVQTRGRASRRLDSTFVVICNKTEKDVENDLRLREQKMLDAIGELMKDTPSRSQAEEFGCESKKPSLLFPKAEEESESVPIERYSPRVTVSVHNMEGDQSRVLDFLNNSFDVLSAKAIQTTSTTSDVTEKKNTSQLTSQPTSQHMTFELQPYEDNSDKEFRSQEGFVCHVTEAWCSRLTKEEEEPLPVWLQSSLPKKRRRPREPLHWLKPNSMFLGSFVNRCHFRCEWPLQPIVKDIRIKFDHSFKTLELFLSVHGNSYKVELRYDELEDFIVVDSNMNAEVNKVFLSVRHPPRLYQSVITNEDILIELLQGLDVPGEQGNDGDADEGMNDSSDDRSDTETFDSEGFTTDEEYPDVVRNFHERRSPGSSQDDRTWERVSDIEDSENAWGQCFTYCLAISSKESVQLRRLLTAIERRFDKKSFYCRVKESFGRFPDVNIPTDLPFDVKYATQSVLSFHPAIRGRVHGTFGVLLQSKAPRMVVAALEKIKKIFEQDPFCDPYTTLQELLDQKNPSTSGIEKRLVPSHCALIKRAVITPMRLLLYPPEVMVKNRVLRHYETGDFLCVSIRDEDLSKMSAARGSIDLVLDDVNRKLDEGLGIVGQRFHFLGSSNSQLRNHSCWFVGPSSQPDDMRRWMGDFRDIRCVASYMARMGQCFSTSMDAVGFEVSEGTFYDEEDDVKIKTDDGKYCFSDGVGKISQELATEVVKKIAKSFKPSAFQIRFAGYKGVLALDPSLSGKRAVFRPSMRKFESFHRRLEVLQTSRPQAVYLNHQVIMLLSNLGVPDEVFIQLQSDILNKLAGMLVNELDAIQLLGTGAKMGVSYHSLSTAGIPLTTEPFFKSLLVAMYRNHIHELLARARILLPPEKARLMMGVMDESGVLKPGQVYVQYSAVSTRADREDEFNKNIKLVLRGPVVVTRNPCLHPGDVRQLEAVDVPQLSHLVDCVVFPRQGSRPHPNEMAGGDLDGDLYFVCWNESLLPRKPNFPPMDYPTLEKKEQDGPITTADMTKFVVDYIRSDQLGLIDNAHKALADVEKGGVESEICLHLAELHSLAVDAPKTGKWPKMPPMKLREVPDFMMKSDKVSYPSDKLLGKLYRRCRKFKDTASEKHCQKMRVDKAFLLPGYDQFIEDAREVYQRYRAKMEALMSVYGIETEAEVFTGCFIKLRNRLRKEKNQIAEIVGELVFAIRSELRREFFREFRIDGELLVESVHISDEMLLKASAWYQVAYTHAHDHADDSDPVHVKRLLAFPWFINDVMLLIKERKEAPISAQSLDVSKTVGESLARLFNEEKNWLLEELKARVRVKMSICRHLKSFQPNLSISMIGSTATLLFHQKSDLDLCIVPQKDRPRRPRGDPVVEPEDSVTSIEDQAKILKALIPHLKEEQQPHKEDSEPQTVKNLFYRVRLVNKKQFPVIACKRPTEKLTASSSCSSSLCCDLSSSPDSISVAILLSSYMKSYPQLLLVLRAVHRWCCVTGLSRNAAGAGNISNMLATLLLFQCMRKGQIKNFNGEHITSKKNQLLQGAATDGNEYMEWERIIEGACSENQIDSHHPQGELNIGAILMTFFQTCDSSFEIELPESLARIMRVRKLAELLDEEHLLLLKEHMQRAYQLLALYGDVQIMLAISGSEDYIVIFLNPLLASYLAGVEKSKAQGIAKKTGATSIVIRPRLPRSRTSAILEVKGSEPAIRAVERELDRMTTQASRDRVSLMSGCFVEDASLLLFEGSRNQNDHVTLTPYDGPCHQTHDNIARHLALIQNVSYSENTFNRFREKFFQQLHVLENDFDPQLHGCYEFAVHFGRVYMFAVPHSLLEDSESITIAMLRANKRKPGVNQTNRKAPDKPTYVNPEIERARRRKRKPKRPVTAEEEKKKRIRANPSRSSFYTAVHSPDRVEEFLERFGFQPETNPTEKYSVDICPQDQDVEFYVRFDNRFDFIEVKFPNLRWCVVDVKRPWQQRPDRDVTQDGRHVDYVTKDGRHADDDVTMDGWETDVRFMLTSQYTLGPGDIRDTKYVKYQCVLEPSNDALGWPFRVQEDLWKDVRLIRYSKLRKFKHASPPGGFLSGLTVYLDEVTEYSRPKPEVGEFGSDVTRFEVSLEAVLPTGDQEQGNAFKFPAKETIKGFLHEVWEFAFKLSSFVSLTEDQL